MRPHNSLILYGISLLLAQACGSDVVWNKTSTLPSSGWEPCRTVEFAMEPQDSILWQTKAPFTATLNLRYTRDCPLASVRLMIERESLDAILPPDTVTVALFDDDNGNAMGVLQKSVTIFSDSAIRPMMRIAVTPLEPAPVKGITHATLIIR